MLTMTTIKTSQTYNSNKVPRYVIVTELQVEATFWWYEKEA